MKSLSTRLILGALAVAIFALSLQDDWDLEITLSQPSHGFIAKISKDSKEKAGSDNLGPVAAIAIAWHPSFSGSPVASAHPRTFPTLALLRSIAVRAPPSALI
ncbi:MAG TPA: hypothetical protein VL754_06285 [Verrucomicrobiae bacterium]|nr:hypothetical protein [Verrucomicrobiae bacterium]